MSGQPICPSPETGGAEGGTRTRTTLRSLDPEPNSTPFLLLDVFLLSLISIDFLFFRSTPFSSMLFSECPKFVPKFPSESGYFHGRLCSSDLGTVAISTCGKTIVEDISVLKNVS